MPKTKAPPVNLDKYLEGRNHKYMTYEKASRLYGIPYWASPMPYYKINRYK